MLVVVNVVTRAADAEPLKKRDAKTVQTSKKMYRQKISNLPMFILAVDSGSELKDSVKRYCEKENVLAKVGTVGRSRQQAVYREQEQAGRADGREASGPTRRRSSAKGRGDGLNYADDGSGDDSTPETFDGWQWTEASSMMSRRWYSGDASMSVNGADHLFTVGGMMAATSPS